MLPSKTPLTLSADFGKRGTTSFGEGETDTTGGHVSWDCNHCDRQVCQSGDKETLHRGSDRESHEGRPLCCEATKECQATGVCKHVCCPSGLTVRFWFTGIGGDSVVEIYNGDWASTDASKADTTCKRGKAGEREDQQSHNHWARGLDQWTGNCEHLY